MAPYGDDPGLGMRIIVYGKAFVKPHVTGVERVGYELVSALAARPDVEIIVVSGRSIRHALPDSVRVVRLPIINDVIFLLLFGAIARLLRGDWILTPNSAPCLLTLGMPQAVCVHDTAWTFAREKFTWAQYTYLITIHRLTARLATLTYCPSRASARDFARFFKVRGSLAITPWGADHLALHDAGEAVALLTRDHGRDPAVCPVILTVGTLQPRKGYATVIAALRLVAIPVTYVVIGNRGWMSEAIEEEIATFNREQPNGSRIVWLRGASDQLIASMFTAARLFVLASEYEGFGLPVVEAMRAGCPVAVADNSSLRELVTDDQWMFPTGEAARLASIIVSAVRNDDAWARQRLLSNRSAKRFTWKHTAALLLSQMH